MLEGMCHNIMRFCFACIAQLQNYREGLPSKSILIVDRYLNVTRVNEVLSKSNAMAEVCSD